MDTPKTSWSEISELIDKFGNEQNVARRIRALRERQVNERGEPDPWTQVELAERMTRIGHAMNKTSIWKIENPDKKAGRRSISIGELIGFAKVFDLTIADLLLPEAAIYQVEAWNLVIGAAEALNDVRNAWQRYYFALQTAQVNIQDSPQMLERVQQTHDDERTKFIDAQRKHWSGYQLAKLEQGEPRPDESEFEAFALAQGPTPLVAALEDVLALTVPRHDAWARERLVDAERP